jgi:uncharacterized protein
MYPSRRAASLFAFSIFLLGAGRLPAQGREAVLAGYTKYEHDVPMRDGVTLFTAVYIPKDASQRYPIILVRTPYGVSPYGSDQYKADLGPSPAFAKEGYIFAYQDVRGRRKSEGVFADVRPQVAEKHGPKDIDESSDAYDTIDWLVKNVPGNSGSVGLWGISYPGFYAACGAIDAHPALEAVSPQAPVSEWFIGDDFHHNGCFYLAHAFTFFSGFGRPRPEPGTLQPPRFEPTTPDGYRYFLDLGPLANIDAQIFKGEIAFWKDLMAHPNYDEFWRARSLLPHLKGIRPAVMTVGGWFDAEDLYGALQVYRSIEESSPGACNILVMGPWPHGGWNRSDGDSLGHVRFGQKTSTFFQDEIELPFFNYHLKGKGDHKLPEAFIFETGTNVWRRHEAWPPRAAVSKRLYLREGGALSLEAPRGGDDGSFDEYISDPAKPVPYIPGISYRMTREHMVDDQRFAASRTDVLVYQTEPLSKDVTLAGPLSPDLHVSTTGTDSDWVVKLIDVYPDDLPDDEPNPTGFRRAGCQQLLRGEAFRGKFRESFEKPVPFTPGRVTRVAYRMPDVCHTFRRGHRIMVQIQSSWFPLVDRNPQTFVDIYRATAADFQKATQRVYRSEATPSSLGMMVIE